MNYVVSNNNGATKFTGSTNIAAPESAKAFDVYDYSEGGYKGVSVEVGTTGKITGKIEVDSRTGADATLTIKSGTFTSEIKDEWVARGFTSMQNADGTYAVGEGVSDVNFTLTVDGGYHADSEGAESNNYDVVFNVNSTYTLKDGESYGMLVYLPGNEKGLDIRSFDDNSVFNTIITDVPNDASLVVMPYVYNETTIVKCMSAFAVMAGNFTKWLGK